MTTVEVSKKKLDKLLADLRFARILDVEKVDLMKVIRRVEGLTQNEETVSKVDEEIKMSEARSKMATQATIDVYNHLSQSQEDKSEAIE